MQVEDTSVEDSDAAVQGTRGQAPFQDLLGGPEGSGETGAGERPRRGGGGRSSAGAIAGGVAGALILLAALAALVLACVWRRRRRQQQGGGDFGSWSGQPDAALHGDANGHYGAPQHGPTGAMVRRLVRLVASVCDYVRQCTLTQARASAQCKWVAQSRAHTQTALSMQAFAPTVQALHGTAPLPYPHAAARGPPSASQLAPAPQPPYHAAAAPPPAAAAAAAYPSPHSSTPSTLTEANLSLLHSQQPPAGNPALPPAPPPPRRARTQLDTLEDALDAMQIAGRPFMALYSMPAGAARHCSRAAVVQKAFGHLPSNKADTFAIKVRARRQILVASSVLVAALRHCPRSHSPCSRLSFT